MVSVPELALEKIWMYSSKCYKAILVCAKCTFYAIGVNIAEVQVWKDYNAYRLSDLQICYGEWKVC